MLKKLLHARGYPIFVNPDLVRFIAPYQSGTHAFVIFDQHQKVLVQGSAEDVSNYLFMGGLGPPTARRGSTFESADA